MSLPYIWRAGGVRSLERVRVRESEHTGVAATVTARGVVMV